MVVKSVLVVEDDVGNQHFMRCLLNKLFPDVQVSQAYDGQEALDLLNSDETVADMILLDLSMPGMDGFEFLDKWSLNPASNDTKLAVVTSSNSDKDKEKALEYACVGEYITKPLDVEDFKELVGEG